MVRFSDLARARLAYLLRKYGVLRHYSSLCTIPSPLTERSTWDPQQVVREDCATFSDQLLKIDSTIREGPATQQAATFTASPPRLVSLYLDDISSPVWRIVSIT